MKIIRKGIGQKWWVGKCLDCYHCHAIIQIETKDEIQTNAEGQPYFKCPECGNETSVKAILKNS